MAPHHATTATRVGGLLLGAAVLVTLTGCVTTSDVESIQSQLSDIQHQVLQVQKQGSSKQEVQEMEAGISGQMQTLLKTEADMRVEIENLSNQIDALQAKLEDTNYRLAQLSQQIATTNQELKVQRESGGVPASDAPGTEASPEDDNAPPPPRNGAVPAVPADPQALYQAAYNDYLRGQYELSVLGFKQYLEAFPNTDLADNAQYWIGESYFGQGKYQQAIREFDQVIEGFEKSEKRASAMLKKGYALLELGDRTEGVLELQHVIRDFPSSDEANLARQRLQNLGVDARS